MILLIATVCQLLTVDRNNWEFPRLSYTAEPQIAWQQPLFQQLPPALQKPEYKHLNTKLDEENDK